MEELQKNFELAAQKIKKLAANPTDDEKLELYALFKQGKHGDVNIDRPSGWFDIVGKAKWDAWNGKKGMDQNTAKEKYISLVYSSLDRYGETN